jgi:beta-galactosidase
VEAVLRRGAGADFLFLIDHAGGGAEVAVTEGSTELLTGERVVGGSGRVPAGGVAVVREVRS